MFVVNMRLNHSFNDSSSLKPSLLSFKSFVVLDVHLQMCSFYFNVLDATVPISIHDPTPIPGKAILLEQANENVQDPVM